jgi:DNA-directed RNA polymerase specialized sigma subunit
MTTAKEKDIELWKKWHRTRAVADLEALMAQTMPLLRREVGRWSAIAPAFVLEAEAKKLAVKAFENFDPHRGVQLSTHLTNQLQKLSRFAYARQSSVSVPEHHRITFNRYQKVRAQQEDELGHPPKIEHIADRLAMPVSRLQSIVQNVEKKEFLESGEGPAFAQKSEDDLIHLAYSEMTPQQKRIFEMRTGYNHTPIKDGATIMKELKISQGVLSYEVAKVKTLLERMQTMR